MPIELSSLINLAAVCAPAVEQGALLSIAKVESGFEPLAIGVNGRSPRRLAPASRQQAIETASKLIAAGENIDLGLGQINSKNLSRLGLSVSDVFDPCINLAASAKIFSQGYVRANLSPGQERRALLTALSLYNTGHPQRGFENGYVAKVVNAATQLGPAILALQAEAPEAIIAPQPVPSAPPTWDVFAKARAVSVSFVFSPATLKGVSP